MSNKIKTTLFALILFVSAIAVIKKAKKKFLEGINI